MPAYVGVHVLEMCPDWRCAPEVSPPWRCALIVGVSPRCPWSLQSQSPRSCPGVLPWQLTASLRCLRQMAALSWNVSMNGDGMFAMRDRVLRSRGLGNGLWCGGPAGVLRMTSNCGPAEGWIGFRWLVFGPASSVCCWVPWRSSFSLDFILLRDLCNLNNLL